MENEVSYRQVGREKGYVPPPRLKDEGVQGQAGGKRDAFGIRTERFSKTTVRTSRCCIYKRGKRNTMTFFGQTYDTSSLLRVADAVCLIGLLCYTSSGAEHSFVAVILSNKYRYKVHSFPIQPYGGMLCVLCCMCVRVVMTTR